jgi:hypothetical protein
LRDAIGRLFPACELRLQFLARQGFDVGRHTGKLNGGGREAKWVNFQMIALGQLPINDYSAIRFN